MASMKNENAKLEITNIADSQGDKEWWASQTVVSRLNALLKLRIIVYGDAATGRLQRVFDITELR